MNERMRPMTFDRLMDWALAELKDQGTLFGVHGRFVPEKGKALEMFGEKMETPIGPAAGPQTQLAQNIVAAYFAGARFFELKTVQTLDGEDLPVSKPCILVEDEGYNVEWSTELTVAQAFEEYVHAWYALKLLSHSQGLGDPEGFVFNMSVGYDYEGICEPKIDAFIEGLKDAGKTPVWKAAQDYALSNRERLKLTSEEIRAISPRVCRSITLSTLHGCPPKEIERIARHLLLEKKLHTYVKCNPTLLGYDFARKRLDELGFDYLAFDDHHFRHDLQYEEGLEMFRRLSALAQEHKLTFGLKLSNTFPVKIRRQELPGEEMYMSGRALFPLTLHLARRLTEAFQGQLPISFSGGVDLFNAEALFQAGIWPITLATTLLKPGGYERLTPMARGINGLPYPQAHTPVDRGALVRLEEAVTVGSRYRKGIKERVRLKSLEKVPLWDCDKAPCQDSCPIHQDIPAYLALVHQKRYVDALKVILDKNPLPFMTGTLCSHRCMSGCVRNDYEAPVEIRRAKLLAAQKGLEGLLKNLPAPPRNKACAVGIVGAGPAGLAAAYFLRMGGLDVTVFDKAQGAGGMVREVIPSFRIRDEDIDQDVKLLEHLGVEFVFGREVQDLDGLLASGFDYLVLAIGAWKSGTLNLGETQALPVLEFLKAFKANPKEVYLGREVAVIGGGNTAMDAARAALRVKGVEKVKLLYRRTRKYMPADEEELRMALEDGVEFLELLGPERLSQGQLTCRQMVLGEPDGSGRCRPESTEVCLMVPAETVIAAVGEKVDSRLFLDNNIALDEKEEPLVGADGATSRRRIYVTGDALNGPSTIVEAIAAARKTADAILQEGACLNEVGKGLYQEDIGPLLVEAQQGEREIYEKRGRLAWPKEAEEEGERCLDCASLCENCVQVCPNRANLAIHTGKTKQIIHMDALCNACGNCSTFCPYSSDPYKEKWTLFETLEDFETGPQEGFVLLEKEVPRFRIRLDQQIFEWSMKEGSPDVSKEIGQMLNVLWHHYPYLFE